MQSEAFHAEVEEAIRIYETINGFAATRTRRMIRDHGEVGALSQLMESADLQQGFKVLRDSGQLDKTFEAIVVKHKDLFSINISDAAQWRLDNPYDLF